MYVVMRSDWNEDLELYDYTVIKVFEDKDKADRFCEMKNTPPIEDVTYYVEEELEKG